MPITKGFATWLGTIGAAAAILIPLIGSLADAAQPLGVPPQTWVVVSAVLACVVIVGRMAQAVAHALVPPALDDTAWPEELPVDATDVPPDQL